MTTIITTPTILLPEHEAHAKCLLRQYFGTDEHGAPFGGASFGVLGHRWDDPRHRYAITQSDVLSLSTLSVPVEARAAIALLSDRFLGAATECLREIPFDANLGDVGAMKLLGSNSPGLELWKLVDSVPTMGPVRTSKLLARKRPALIPIYDDLSSEVLGLDGSGDMWRPMHTWVTEGDPSVLERAGALRISAEVPDTVPPLRVVDVVCWMYKKYGHKTCSRKDTPCCPAN